MAVVMTNTALFQLLLCLLLPLAGYSLQFVHTKPGSLGEDDTLSNLNDDLLGRLASSPTNNNLPPISSDKSPRPLLGSDSDPAGPHDITTGAKSDAMLALFKHSQYSDSGQPHQAMMQPVPLRDNSTLTLAYLVVDRTRTYVAFRGWKVVSGALSYAIEKINAEGIVPGYNLTYVIRDTRGVSNDSLMEMSRLWRDGVVGFVGPANTCKHEALMAAAWNLPILSHVCSEDQVSDKTRYPTFARTFPPAVQITKSVIALLKFYNWTKFSIVYGDIDGNTYEDVAVRLQDLAREHNMSINHVTSYPEPHLTLIRGNPFPSIIQSTYVDTRVYVFLGYLNAVVDMMINMNDRGLLDTGQYVVIYAELLEHLSDEPTKYFRRTYEKGNDLPNMKGARSLLVVKQTPTQDTSQFHDNVRFYNKQPPLNFPEPGQWKKIISVHASYLYDLVMLYARALGTVVSEGGSFLDGKRIVGEMFGKTYQSIEGYLVKIDENGDAEGNYSVLSCQPNTFIDGGPEYLMLPVANFRLNQNGVLPMYQLYDGMDINWLNDGPPVAEPACGYRGQKCIKPKSHLKEIVAGIFGGIVLIAIVTCLLIYRNWRYEQEIAGLLWKIEVSAIHCTETSAGRADKKALTDDNDNDNSTNCGISMVSIESRNSYAQVYTYIGKFKGQTVALKTFNLDSSDLTRKHKMEMKTMRDLRHTNVNSFIGACLESSILTLVTTYCVKGSLQDVLENDDIKLDDMFIASLIKDLLQGMLYLHTSDLVYHGNLKSSNCVVNSRWTLQVTDHGLLDTRNSSYRREDHHAYYRNLLWKAPEILRSNGKLKASQLGDVYAFAIILHEIFGRQGPYGNTDMDPEDIIGNVTRAPDEDKTPFRPDTSVLNCDDYVIDVMTSCWAEVPESRPNFHLVWNRLKPMRTGMKRNIFDHMLAMMEKYQEHLEELVDERTEQLQGEKRKTESLLYRMLPRSVADHLKKGEAVIPEAFDSVTIYFSDICGFTALSAESSPMQIVDMLNDLYTCFDSIIKNFDVYKVETIGDAYMVVSGLPIRNGNSHAAEIASMSLSLLLAIKSFTIRHKPGDTLKLRIGIHSGSCVAGIVGLTMPRYTLFGDTVNTASRMESNGEALKIHCSASCKHILDLIGGFQLDERGYVTMKGKGEQLTYWLRGEDRSQRSDLQHGHSQRQVKVTQDMLDTAENALGCTLSPHGPSLSPHGPSLSPHGIRRDLTAPNTPAGRAVSTSIEHHCSGTSLPSSTVSASNLISSPVVTAPCRTKSPREINSRTHHHFSFSSPSPSPKTLSASNQAQLLHPHHNSFSGSVQHKSVPPLDNDVTHKCGSYPEGINGIPKQHLQDYQQQQQQQQEHKLHSKLQQHSPRNKHQTHKSQYRFLKFQQNPPHSPHKLLHGDLSQSQNLETKKRPAGKRASRKHCVSMGDNPVSSNTGSGSIPTEASTLLMDYLPLAPINGTHV